MCRQQSGFLRKYLWRHSCRVLELERHASQLGFVKSVSPTAAACDMVISVGIAWVTSRMHRWLGSKIASSRAFSRTEYPRWEKRQISQGLNGPPAVFLNPAIVKTFVSRCLNYLIRELAHISTPMHFRRNAPKIWTVSNEIVPLL